jgi:hypothetical protein
VGEGGYTSTILNLGTRSRLVVTFTPLETALGTQCVEGWVGPRAGLDAVEKRKSCSYRESNPDFSVVKPAALSP